jgi:hypothetical protein
VISWAVAIGIIGIGIGYAAKSEMNSTGFEPLLDRADHRMQRLELRRASSFSGLDAQLHKRIVGLPR